MNKKVREINYFLLTGKLTQIGELQHIERASAPSMYKRLLTLELSDGQILFPEIRNNRLKQLEEQNVQEGDLVSIEMSFEGSQKGDKRYNNLYINKITKL